VDQALIPISTILKFPAQISLSVIGVIQKLRVQM